MTTKLSAKRFRIRRPEPVAPLVPPQAAANEPEALFLPVDDGFGNQSFLPSATPPGTDDSAAAELDAIRREGLTGRQLRLARRIAARHNLPATSDFDAVRLLRRAGIDPFQRTPMIDLATADGEPVEPDPAALVPSASPQLPQVVKPIQVPSTETRAEVNHAAEIFRLQQDIARRRRRKLMLLGARLAFFVLLPTFLAGIYYYLIATPLYSTRSEFVIQQSSSPVSSGGLGGLLQGSPMATSQDSITVQGYLQSRDAMMRLDTDHGFRAAFSAETMDPIQRLQPDASLEAAYKVFTRHIQIAYDPTEGLIKMEVIAPDPQLAADFSQALISYAEEQVDQLTQRLREDQMKGARESYENAEVEMLEAQRRVVELQERFKVLSSEVEVSLITGQIGQLESQLTADRLSLAQMESNAQPNQARMQPLIRRIATLESEIAALRAKLTEDDGNGMSLAQVQSELLVAQADVQTRQLLLAQSLQALETARLEANRQVRYLSVSVNPVAPDEAAYPRAFENTLVALLIFAGIYLMISMTAAILREQVSA
jgi:capsular polysaccharide transport system permease protein